MAGMLARLADDAEATGPSAALLAPFSGLEPDAMQQALPGIRLLGALNEDRNAQVSYQPPGETAQPAPFTPFLHVTLTDVH